MCLVTPECRDQSVVESESHFLLWCGGYRDLRQSLYDKLALPSNFYVGTDTEQISILINTPEFVKPTAQFIIDAFNLRMSLASFQFL